MTICRPYDENTTADFRRLFVERFPTGDVGLLDVMLSNPARRGHPGSGAIAYDEEGSVKAIQGLVPRVVYCGQDRLSVINGMALAVRKDVNRDFFSGFVRDSILSAGADLYFVNTAIPPSRKRVANSLEGLADGPDSCAEIRERDLMAGKGVFARGIRKVCAKLEMGHSLPAGSIDEVAFDVFWRRYLEGHQGLVTSRTAAELKWVFDAGLKTGEVILTTVVRGGELVGYVFCRRTDETAVCWRVVDLIALGDDEAILEELIASASAFLRHHTRATCLQITGFPTWVQPLLKRLFPKSVSLGFNKCIWVCLNEKSVDLCGDWVNANCGWYGCPYDGDMCLV